MEHFSEEVIRLDRFLVRVIRSQLLGSVFLILGLLPGVLGFCLIEQLSWHDSLLNALSMLGTVDLQHAPQTLSGKYFIAFYGLFLNSVFLVALGMVVTPFAHRALHLWSVQKDRKSDG